MAREVCVPDHHDLRHIWLKNYGMERGTMHFTIGIVEYSLKSQSDKWQSKPEQAIGC